MRISTLVNSIDATNKVAACAHSISVSTENVPVLHHVNASFMQGRWTSIVGPNGAGKSTLLKALAGLLPCSGTVSLLGQPLQNWPRQERARCISWLGQNEASADDLCVYDVAMLGRIPHQSWLAAPTAADHAVVEQVLRTTQAWDWRERVLGSLSGGERQRVLLARALAVQAQVLLMDEPLANLDPPHQADWLATVKNLTAQGSTVISVFHEVSMALQADDMLILAQGKVAHMGACADASTHHALEAVFDHRISLHQLAGKWVSVPH